MIEAKIAHMVEATDARVTLVLLNAGAAQGVKPRMRFEVIEETEVRDPDSRRVLETFKLGKGMLIVDRVSEQVAYCHLYDWTFGEPLIGDPVCEVATPAPAEVTS